DDNSLQNEAWLNVTANGHRAIAAGMVVAGDGDGETVALDPDTVVDPDDPDLSGTFHGILFAAAEDDETNATATNAGDVQVMAKSTQLPVDDPDVAVAVGMLGVGSGTMLENEAGAELDVTATGTMALGAGMAVLGSENTAENFGNMTVEANADELALAVG